MFKNILFNKIDNSQLIVFRILFGFLLMLQCWGAIFTGWVQETLVEPEFTFAFIGFEWTRVLLGPGMIYLHIAMGALGLMIMLGAFYRVSSLLFALCWSLTYFIQKEHYNNHYYLVMLVTWVMVFLPAHRYRSIDALIWPRIRRDFMYNWTRLWFILQCFIVYTYAAIAKIYPGWFNGDFLKILYRDLAGWAGRTIEWPWLTELLYSRDFAKIMAWLGFGFDLLIVPLLLWKRTRTIALLAAFFFHLFNSVSLQIGIFPYFALLLSIFFFPPETIRKIFLPTKTTVFEESSSYRKKPGLMFWGTTIFVLYFAWQTYLPLRHHLIQGDVFWTEEGHRLSWRMMLRSKSGVTQFYKIDKETGKRKRIILGQYLNENQSARVQTYPDFMWQFAQFLKKQEAKKGNDIEVYVESKLSVNGSPYYDYIDPNTDLAAVKWKYFGHQTWILPEPVHFSCFE